MAWKGFVMQMLKRVLHRWFVGVLIKWCANRLLSFIWRVFPILTFACSDSAVKQLVLTLDEKEHFIIEDLDETHVLIDANSADRLQDELDQALNENTYSLDGAE